MNKNKLVAALVTAGIVTALNGCSGGGGGGSAAPATSAATGSSMTVSPSLGRFRNAVGNPVSVKLINAAGTVVQTTTLNDTTGQAVFTNLASSLGTLIVEVSGGEYFDEAEIDLTKSYKPTGTNKLRAVVDKPYTGITVSPLTHAASKRLLDEGASGTVTVKSGKNATDVLTENNLEGQRFGVSNPLLLKPVLVGSTADGNTVKISSTDDLESQKYAAVLAGLAVAAKNAGVSPAVLAEELAKDLSDGVIDGMSGTTAIAVDAAKVAALVTDVTTSLDDNSNTALVGLVDSSETLAALQTAVTSSVQVSTELTTAQVAAATQQATVAATASDSMSQARQFFASLRTGITPYATANGTGYTQTAVKNIEAEFATFSSATVSANNQIEAIADATYNVTNQMEGIPPSYSYNANAMCQSDDASLYEAGTTFAARCAIWPRMPVAGTTDYDEIVYFVYTSAPSYTGGALDASFKWVGRVDRYDANGTRKIKGVGDVAGTTNRRNGSFSAKESIITTSTGETGVITLSAFKGKLWPIINNSAVSTTDGTDVDLTVAGTFDSAWDSNGVWTKEVVDFQMSGKLTSYAGSNTLATLEFGSATGSTSVVKADLTKPGPTDSAGLKVTLTTAKTQISGDLSVVGFTSKPGAPYTYFQYVGMGLGNYRATWNGTTNSIEYSLAPLGGTGAFIKVTETPTESNINELKFAGLVRDLVSQTTVFEGTISGSANYANYDPALAEGANNYKAGTATVVGKLKKSATDAGLILTAVLTATGHANDAKQWQVSYKDANGLTVSGNFTAADQSAKLSNSANTITVVLYKTPALNTVTNKYVDGLVMDGTTQLGTISGSMVTYADGLTETIY